MRTSLGQAIRVVLADDHDLVRSGIKALLGMIDGVDVIAEARDGRELVTITGTLLPDVVMTDISMPNMDGLDAIAEIHEKYPQVRLVVLSMNDTVEAVKRAVANGASGYLMKDAPPYELEQALRGLMTSGRYFSPAVAHLLLMPSEPAPQELLTARQLEILQRIAQGQASKEIAYALGLSPKTVDVHRARIMERLDLNDVASLTRYAVRTGLIKP